MYCPKCGSPMVKRVARQGKNAGKEFWGCSTYPKCKEIVNIEDNTTPTNEKTINKAKLVISPYPMQFYASPLEGMNDMQGFQSIAVSANTLSLLRNRLVAENDILTKSRFRVDFSQSKYRLNNEQETICALVLRMLCRGNISINSKKVESIIENLFPSDKSYSDKTYSTYDIESSDNFPFPTDSERESDFLKKYLKPLLGKSWTNYISTQVYISSLVQKDNITGSISESSQRVDFLVSINGKDTIIELDGPEHELHKEKDKERDSALKINGYEVIRFKNQEIDEQQSAVLDKLSDAFKKENYEPEEEKVLYHAIIATKLTHQIQIAIVSALQKGIIPSNALLKPMISTNYFTSLEIKQLFLIIIDDLHELFKNYCTLYGVDDFFDCKYSNKGDVSICLGCTDTSASSKIIISDISFSRNILNNVTSVDSLKIQNYNKKILTYFLDYLFRFKEFREGQQEGIERLLNRKDSIVLLPTGSGKSLIYQLSSLLIPGEIVVISPLTSLMQDQIDNLYYAGIDCVTAIYNGNINNTSETVLFDPRMTLIYISPERLQVKSFRDNINNFLIKNSVFAVAVDEAHCVSEWARLQDCIFEYWTNITRSF